MKDGILKAMPDAEVWVSPMADGGEGTEDAAVCNEHGIGAFFPILRTVVPLTEAMSAEVARRNMTYEFVPSLFRLVHG